MAFYDLNLVTSIASTVVGLDVVKYAEDIGPEVAEIGTVVVISIPGVVVVFEPPQGVPLHRSWLPAQ